MMKKICKLSIFFMLGVILFITLAWAVPTKINYEGRLTDSAGNPLTGSYNMRFTITSDYGGSAAVWGPEEHASVSVSSGVFSVLLGETTLITTAEVSGDTRYLKVEVANPATSTNYEVLTPHSQIVSVAFALRAARSDQSVVADVASDVADGSITAAKLAGGIDISTTGTVTAAAFYGDGSNLSGISAGPASYATLAGSATSAAYATLSGSATTAASADYATLAGTASSAATATTVSDYSIATTKISTNAVTAQKLASDAAVLTFAEQAGSRLTGDVDLKEGTNITLTQTGQTIEITSTAGGGSVTSVDSGVGLTGGPITGAGTISAAYGGSAGDWGTANTLARSDHLHDSNYVELSGDVMTGVLRVPTLEVSASVYMWEDGNNFYLYDPNAGSKTLSQLYLSIASQEATRLNGDVDLKAGSGIKVTQAGQTIEITSTATGSGISAYGELYCFGNTVAQSISTTYSTIASLESAGASSNTTADTANHRITVSNSGTYFVICTISFSGNNSTLYYGGISKNGTVGNNATFARKLGTGGDVGSASCAGVFAMNASDWVDFRMKTPTGSSVTVEYANLSIYKIN